MTRIGCTALENQLVSRQRCLYTNLWYPGECAVLDVGDLELQLRALEIIGHMTVLARLISEGAVEPLEVGGLLEIGLDLIAFGVIDWEHDRVARGAQCRLPDLSSKYRNYSYRVFHRLRNYIVADLHVGIDGGIRTIEYVGRADAKLPSIGRGIVQVLVVVGHV